MSVIEAGTVAKLFPDRGFGFVQDRYGATHYFNERSSPSFDALETGAVVWFELGNGSAGRTLAKNVRSEP
jgi:cold shock CspA family protein